MAFNGDQPRTQLASKCLLISERHSDVAILRLQGEFDLACAELFAEEVGNLLDGDVSQLLVDLRELTFIDSTGLRELTRVNERARKDGFDFAVLCDGEANAPIWRAIEVTGLDRVLPVVDSSGIKASRMIPVHPRV